MKAFYSRMKQRAAICGKRSRSRLFAGVCLFVWGSECSSRQKKINNIHHLTNGRLNHGRVGRLFCRQSNRQAEWLIWKTRYFFTKIHHLRTWSTDVTCSRWSIMIPWTQEWKITQNSLKSIFRPMAQRARLLAGTTGSYIQQTHILVQQEEVESCRQL